MKKIPFSTTLAALSLSNPCWGSDDADMLPATPLAFEAAYTGELWRNVHGGARQDTAYLDNVDLAAAFDAEQAFGLTGTSLWISALYNNRSTFSDRAVGDLQTVSNIDTDGALRLYELWVEHESESAAFKGGLIDLNSEFDVNETGALFINSSHGIGPDFSQVGENGPAIFPITGLGLRARFDLGARVQALAGVFEGTVGDPMRPRHTTVRIDGDEGTLLVGEIRVKATPQLRASVGIWRHSDVATDLSSDGERKRESLGTYALVDGAIANFDRHDLNGFVRIGFADPDIHQIARYQGIGVVLSGPLFAGAAQEEQLGIAVGAVTNGTPFRNMQAAAGTRVERRETAIELTYRIQVNSWLALQPDVQYIINPGTDPALDNALVMGLRFELAYSGM